MKISGVPVLPGTWVETLVFTERVPKDCEFSAM